MTHPRAAIREAFKAALLTKDASGKYQTDAADRVFKARLAPINLNDDDELPAILVYGREESRDAWKDYSSDGDDGWKRAELRIVVEAIVRADEDVDDRLDAMAEQIEAILEAFVIPGYEGAEIRLGDSNIDVITQNVQQPAGAIGLVYHIRYYSPWRVEPDGTRPTDVDVSIDDDPPEPLIVHDRGPYNGGPA